MRRFALFLAMFAILAAGALASARSTPSLPPPPSSKPPDVSDDTKAFNLYGLARKANPRLVWDRCLSRKALIRAKHLVRRNYFDHHDPLTGKNPAWDLVKTCFPCRTAGENLTKGMEEPENIHKALMNSPSHRKNIIDPRFSRIGVACYDYICVQLFAGF